MLPHDHLRQRHSLFGLHDHGHGHNPAHPHHCHDKRSHAHHKHLHGGCRHAQNYSSIPFTSPGDLLRQTLRLPDSRRILAFLALSAAVVVLQLVYGYITNSVGLLTDAIHMVFDCIAMGLSLLAAVAAQWPPDARFSFGYTRLESVAALANAISLLVISMSLAIEAVERLLTRAAVDAAAVLPVALIGLVVNLIGLIFFHDFSHGGSSHGCCGGHKHASHGANLRAVFLHVLADALGSLAVVVSALLIPLTNWHGFDALASLLISGLLTASSLPILHSSLRLLMNAPPTFLMPSDISEIKSRITMAVASSTSKSKEDQLPMQAQTTEDSATANVSVLKLHVWSNDGTDVWVIVGATYSGKSEIDVGAVTAGIRDSTHAAVNEFAGSGAHVLVFVDLTPSEVVAAEGGEIFSNNDNDGISDGDHMPYTPQNAAYEPVPTTAPSILSFSAHDLSVSGHDYNGDLGSSAGERVPLVTQTVMSSPSLGIRRAQQ